MTKLSVSSSRAVLINFERSLILLLESSVMKRLLKLIFLLFGAVSVAACCALSESKNDTSAAIVEQQEIRSDGMVSDAEIDALVKETVATYRPGKGVAGKKSITQIGLSPQLYASLYFYDPFKQPLTGLPTLRRLSKASAEVEFSVDAAENSYGSSGSRENLASRVFGKKDIQLQDLALVVRLSNNNPAVLANIGGGHNFTDFGHLAPLPVEFEAFTHREQVQLGASVALFENSLRLSFGLPVAVGSNQLSLANDGLLQRKVGAAVLAGDFKDYSLSQFIDALATDMKMKSKIGERVTNYGLGQGFVGATYQLPVDSLEQAQIGLQLYMPTTTQPDANRVWPVELGVNNVALAANIDLLWEQQRYFNPYFHADGRFNLASKATRRVPRLVSKGPVGGLPGEKMALGNWVQYAGADFNDEIEATVRGFSDFSSDVNWRLGHSMTLQVGNIFERVIGRGGYLDLAYRFNIKLKDQVLGVQTAGSYHTDPLVVNTDEIAHQLRLGYGYHFTDNFRLSVLGSLVFAGKNVAQVLGVSALFGFSF